MSKQSSSLCTTDASSIIDASSPHVIGVYCDLGDAGVSVSSDFGDVTVCVMWSSFVIGACSVN